MIIILYHSYYLIVANQKFLLTVDQIKILQKQPLKVHLVWFGLHACAYLCVNNNFHFEKMKNI